ncbi:MAG: RecQ family ATP-dependent DNA helicase [Acidovorax sp.]|uniref:RecQ family ATP-dependent DNA helicase n=1 Tax=Acidovorax sp. TaxID=1872122 RepID=UPI0039E3DCC1
MTTQPDPATCCLCIDVGTSAHDRLDLRDVGAFRPDLNERLHLKKSTPDFATRLDHFTHGAHFVLGHNCAQFDQPVLAHLYPALALHRLPQVDTLELSPIAFPQNPYHRLVKDYKLCTTSRNDSVRDAELAHELFLDQCQALRERAVQHPEETLCLHFLLTSEDAAQTGLAALLQGWRGEPRPSLVEAKLAWMRATKGKVCATAQRRAVNEWLPDTSWHKPLAYTLAWLRVAGGNSVLPPWVGHAHPRTREAIRALRDTPCNEPQCDWCREQHRLDALLPRFFPKITDFRASPSTPDGRSLQRVIVEHGMAGTPTLAILPTGGGKSVCYQLPALAHFFRTGCLTVVVSPLQSLMKDQVDGLLANGITCAGYLNSLLTPLERRATLDKLRLGDLGLIFVAPEQFRSTAFTHALTHREVRAWVFDEAHCLSKWGHDFRPDYLYVSRFIRKTYKNPSPVFCFTATAKPDVVQDICQHFGKHLGMQLSRLEGGVERKNLLYEVHAVPTATKYAAALRLLQDALQDGGGAIVFCARQKTVEEVAGFLKSAELKCAHFHGGMQGEEKRAVQEAFIRGDLQVIAATNAFGMGVDKPDVRLVIHLDTPGSLENYLQEAGRAGRDQAPARCVLLHDEADMDVQFRLLKNARLTQGDIQSILRALRAIRARDRAEDEVVASTGEILRQTPDKQRIDPDARDADTKVRIAIAWLEESRILERHENHTRVFPGSLLVANEDEARERLLKKLGADTDIAPYLAIVSALMNTEDDESLSTDELMGITGLDSRTIAAMLRELDRWRLLSNDTELGVIFHKEPPTTQRLAELAHLENALLTHLRETAPDADQQEWQPLDVRSLCDVLRRDTQLDLDPPRLGRLLKSFAEPFGESGGDAQRGFFAMRPGGGDLRHVRLQRSWQSIEATRARRMRLAQALVATFDGLRKNNALLATCKQGELEALLQADATLADLEIKDWDTALRAALLYLDANEVLHLARGKAVFRSAMRIRFDAEANRRQFSKADYAELALHYKDKTIQIHVMAEYAKLALHKAQEAMRFIVEYFSLSWQEFVRRWFADRKDVLELATTEAAHRRILTELRNPAQQAIVAAKPEGSQLVLAGPGAGKTRVIVHRIAWLLRECMVQPEEIMVLTYNRSAAAEIRARLWSLVGQDAAGVAVQTLHSLAMRLTGTSYAVALERGESIDFSAVIRQATACLQKAAPSGGEDDETSLARERLLAGLRFLLVDEYQDINGEHYALISALAGRSLQAEHDRLSLMAVGDDDQNIYAFDGADVRYIRQFEADYQAQRFNLLENYRSTAHIIDCAAQVIAPARNRMKHDQQLRIDQARRDQPAGGDWARMDSLTEGRVHVLEVPPHDEQEASIALAELERLYALRGDTDNAGRWGHFAVLARRRDDLDALHALCRSRGIPVQRMDEKPLIPLHASREGAALLNLLRGEGRSPARKRMVLRAQALSRWFRRYGPRQDEVAGNPFLAALGQFIEETQAATPQGEVVADDLIDDLYEFDFSARKTGTPRPHAPLLLMTAHRAKGLEFDHALILDAGGWQSRKDEERRLFYVAMTRARQTLTLCERIGQRHPFVPDVPPLALRTRPAPPPMSLAASQRVRTHTCKRDEVYLSWPGRQAPPVHQVIAALRIGDPLTLRPRMDSKPGWELTSASGQTVGQMSSKFALPPGHIVAARVAAIHARTAKPGDTGARCQRWEVVLPEFDCADV